MPSIQESWATKPTGEPTAQGNRAVAPYIATFQMGNTGTRLFILHTLIASVFMVLFPATSFSQRAPSGIPLDVHQGQARTDPTGITFCVDQREADWRLHYEVGEAIASSLLLEAKFYIFGPELTQRVNEVAGLPDNLLFVLLDDHCDAFLGIRIHPRAVFPDFFAVSRPYMLTGYVLAYSDERLARLDNIRRMSGANKEEIVVGVPGDSAANLSLAVFMPEVKRRVFRSEAHLLGALVGGEIKAGLFWEPTLYALRSNRKPEGSEALFVNTASPMPATEWSVGIGLMSTQVYLRQQIDEAIRTLTEEGAIAEILKRHGFLDGISMVLEPNRKD